MEIKKNDIFDVEVTGVTADGNGVGRVDGFAVFIPQTAVGDLARVKIVKVNKNYGFGKLEELITPSAHRINPDCTSYNQCGGCSFRHISYEAELDIKHDIVQQAFSRIGNINAPVSSIIGSKSADGYRNKAQYPVAINPDGDVLCGFFAKRSHRVVDSNSCALQPHIFAEIKSFIVELIKVHLIAPYDEVSGKGELRHIYLRNAERTNEIMVCFVVNGKLSHQAELVNALIAKFDAIKSIVVNINNKNTNVILGQHCVTIWGQDYITDSICGLAVQISPLSFYQVNRRQAEVLYTTALALAKLTKDDVLVDLYCGTGTIGLIAARDVKQVVGVEIIPQAIQNAVLNAQNNNITNALFICDDAGKAAQRLLRDSVSPTVVVVDPPRKGLDLAVINAISLLAPDRLVMISCNPATAARDAELLVKRGFTVSQIIPVDMFPRTTHVECVVLMSRK